MKVKQEKVGENKVVLEVEISKDKVKDALNKAYKKVVKEVNIPGFRKGKVPRKMLEKKFGKEVLHKDALDILIPQGYYDAVQEAGIEPIDQPEITEVFIEAGKDAKFKAEVEVKPEVTLGDYKGLEVEKEEAEVSDELVESELKSKQSQNAQLVSTDRDVVEEGDHTLIDFEGFVDGEAFEGGAGEDYNLEIGSGQFIPGFEEQLIGATVGEEIEVNVAFPEDYHADNLAGKDSLFKVTVKEIKVKEEPELDDEFAKDLGFDSLDALKEDTKNNLVNKEEERVNREFENNLIEAIAQNAEINIPETMVDSEIDNMLQGFKAQIQQQGMSFEDYLEATGMEEAKIREEYKENAQSRVRVNLTLEAIADEENIEVSEEEVDQKVEEIAERQGQEKDMVKSFLQMQGQLSALRNSLKMEKTINFLVENN
ncbi:trigger factor [Halonatronum saccharophilum]|uniref:trigger factor n=1 Tax=Halonatronum saccharophilum TaxID=150060 RepID=UPI000483D898|nr:trigger factor [Halonatronum saccharophilum]